MVAGEVESSCQLVVTFFFFFFLVSPYQTIEISLSQPSPPSYQLLPPPLKDIITQVTIATQIICITKLQTGYVAMHGSQKA